MRTNDDDDGYLIDAAIYAEINVHILPISNGE